MTFQTEHPIAIWYGPIQRFGHLGRPQRWLNVLGNVAESHLMEGLTFSINGVDARRLELGSDLHRLARPGDFNIELAWEEVDQGENTLVIAAIPKGGKPITTSVKLIVEEDNIWPLPYYLDFSSLKNIQDAVQIVDGLWHLEASGVRTAQPYYDRVLAMGDASWSNYETRVRLTLHSFTPSDPGPPTYDVTHFGVAMRWRGHHTDGLQPRRKWFPLGAQGEFLLREDGCQWRILFDHPEDKPVKYAGKRNSLILGQPITIKTQVTTMPDGRTRYRFKQWNDSEPESMTWDVEGFEENDYASGALCLVTHNSDATIHEISVEPLGAIMGDFAV